MGPRKTQIQSGNVADGFWSRQQAQNGLKKTRVEECLNEDTTQTADNKQLDVLLDLQNEINDKLNRNNKNDSSTTSEPNLQGMPEGFSPFIGEMMKNKDLQEKMNDPSFKEKMMKNKDNPMGLLNDPEVMNLVGKLACNLNMGNK